MDAEAVEMFTAPVEGELENLMELGEAGFATDEKAPPTQGTDVPKHDSQLIKVCHLRSLPDLARRLHNYSPGIFCSPPALLHLFPVGFCKREIPPERVGIDLIG